MSVRAILKALPLGILFTLVTTAASVGPGDVVKNISNWINLLGFTKLSNWLAIRVAGRNAIALFIFLGFLYVVAVWGVPRLRDLSVSIGDKRRLLGFCGMLACSVGFAGFTIAYFWIDTATSIASSAQPTSAPDQVENIDKEHVTLHDLFLTDLSGGSFNIFQSMTTELVNIDGKASSMDFQLGIFGDFTSNSQFISLYVPVNDRFMEFITWFSTGYINYLHDAKTNMHIWTNGGFDDNQPISDNLTFTKRIYIYHENILSNSEKYELETSYRNRVSSLRSEALAICQTGRSMGQVYPVSVSRKPQITFLRYLRLIPPSYWSIHHY